MVQKEYKKLGKAEVKWFSNIYSQYGISADLSKVGLTKAWPKPKDKTEVKSFLATVQACQAFMINDLCGHGSTTATIYTKEHQF